MGTTVSDHPTASSVTGTGPTPTESIFVPIGRTRAITRALLRLAPALVVATISWSVLANVRLSGSGGSTPIIDVALALLVVPFGLGAIALGLSGLRWLALALWPRRAGVHADPVAVTLALGPFGTRRYQTDRLEVRYLFECSDDDEVDTFEALLPEEEQIRRFLPIMRHPDAREPLNRVVLRFAAGPESAVARTLRPMIALWRSEGAAAESDE